MVGQIALTLECRFPGLGIFVLHVIGQSSCSGNNERSLILLFATWISLPVQLSHVVFNRNSQSINLSAFLDIKSVLNIFNSHKELIFAFWNKDNFACVTQLVVEGVVSLLILCHQVRNLLGKHILERLVDNELLLALDRFRFLIGSQ